MTTTSEISEILKIPFKKNLRKKLIKKQKLINFDFYCDLMLVF
jgi:hypothetical protein